jgi:hypothetical protein
MSAKVLHVFAINGESDLRHTNLTREQGLMPDLPPLGEWLGVEALDTDRIEVFPVQDLGEMKLSQYVTMAFDPVPLIDAETSARLDALEGSVLLVPDTAFEGVFHPGAEVTEVATLSLALPDHHAELPKADVSAYPEPAPERFPPEKRRGPVLWLAAVALAVIVLVLVIY